MSVSGGVSRTDNKDLETVGDPEKLVVVVGDAHGNKAHLVPSDADKSEMAILVTTNNGIHEILKDIRNELKLLNFRFEEAFQTGTDEGDI